MTTLYIFYTDGYYHDNSVDIKAIFYTKEKALEYLHSLDIIESLAGFFRDITCKIYEHNQSTGELKNVRKNCMMNLSRCVARKRKNSKTA